MKNKIFTQLLCLSLLFVIVSCSNDTEIKNDLSVNDRLQIENLKHYINSEANENTEFKASVSFLHNGEELELFEFKTVNRDKSIYVTLNKLTNTKEHLIFIDRENFTIKIINKEGELNFENINETDDYGISNRFDLISYIKKNLNEGVIKGRKFWGWSCGPEYFLPDGTCIVTCCHHIFWLNNGCDIFTCGNLPGNN